MKKFWLFLLPLSLCLISCGDDADETDGDLRPDVPSDSIQNPKPIAEAVDLGLSVKWASCNIGATSPEESGYYFAWGETTPKDSFPANWETYKFYDFEQNEVCKYTKADSLTVLLPEDDAAHVNWGGEWRMPTAEEFNELLKTCEHIDSTLNGKACVYLKAPNGNGIFMSQNGMINGTRLVYPEYYTHWTASVFTKSYKYGIACRGDLKDGTKMPNNRNRFVGMPIRPVHP